MPPQRIDPAWFPGLPPEVRPTAWHGEMSVVEQFTAAWQALHDPALPAAVAGWIVGITMFADIHRRLAAGLSSHPRVELLPHVLAAFADGVIARVKPPRKLWGSMELIALRSPAIPASFIAIVPLACAEQYLPTHEIGTRLAVVLGEPARAALVAARAAAKDHPTRKSLDRALLAITRAGAAAESSPTRTLELLLQRLLASWRTTRDPILEPEIALLGAELGAMRGPLADEADDSVWLACAHTGDPADVDRLLDAAWNDYVGTVRPRLLALAKHAPDPRLVRLEYLAGVFGWTGAMRAGVEQLLAHDPIDDPARAADPGLLAEARAVTSPIAERARMVATHAADPADLGLRSVLADMLVEAGDPRGELITLQLANAGQRSSKAVDRERELVRLHADRFAAPLPDVVPQSRVFERGFLVAARVQTSVARVLAVSDRPIWSTLERLALDTPTCDPTELVRRMPVLHDLEVREGSTLDALARTGPWPRLRTLVTRASWLPPSRDPFPNLAVVGGRFDAAAGPLAAAGALGVDILVWYADRREPLDELVRPYRVGPRCVRFVAGPRNARFWNLELERGSTHAYLDCQSNQVDPRQYTSSLLELSLGRLASAGVTRLSIHFTDDGARHFDLDERLRDLRGAAAGMQLDLEGRHIDV